jgi:exopolysaccharide biosynthesis polyprenyl glycosylphosphotransferase
MAQQYPQHESGRGGHARDEWMPPATQDSSSFDRQVITAVGTVPREVGPAARPARSPSLRRIMLGSDALAIAFGWTIVLAAGLTGGEVAVDLGHALSLTVLMLAAGLLLLTSAGLYRRRICAIRSLEITRVGRVSLLLGAVTVVVLGSLGWETAGLAGILGGSCWFVALTLERGLLREWINGRRATGDFGAPVLVVGGPSSSTLETARLLADHPVLGFQVRGISCPPMAQLADSPFPWLGASDDLHEQAARCDASGIVVDSSSFDGVELSRIVQEARLSGLYVLIASGLRGIDVRRISVAPLADETFLHVAPLGLNRRQVMTKRVLDVLGGGAALVAFSPVLLLSSFLVWAQDRGPVLFRQQRVGKDGELFTLYKLRTMVPDAERLKRDLVVDNQRAGPLFKLGRDPRVTRVGRFLRTASIDELPQLFNVLEGSMSLVGPRPALPDEVAQFDVQLIARQTVKPGMTGLWQVEARDLPSFDLYRRYDLLYVQNWSLGVDLTVIARTIAVVAFRAARGLFSRTSAHEMSRGE